jgi:hypothetical protein
VRDSVEKSHDNPPKRCNSTRPIGNPPHMKTAIFHEVLRAGGPGQQAAKTVAGPKRECLCRQRDAPRGGRLAIGRRMASRPTTESS